MTDMTLPKNGSFDFSGRVALITGAARGVGQEIAKELHTGGAIVFISDVDFETARHTAKELDASGKSAVALSLNVLKKADFEQALSDIKKIAGKLDIVINNAGHAKRTPWEDISPDEFDDIVAINMRSVFLSSQVFCPHMIEQGYGRIVNITSLAGQNGGTVASAHYASAKAGAIMLTKYFARHLADTGVTVNAVSPGPISTAKGRLSEEQIESISKAVPIGRFATASEIAAATALLASDRGGFFTGATLDMNGGLYLR